MGGPSNPLLWVPTYFAEEGAHQAGLQRSKVQQLARRVAPASSTAADSEFIAAAWPAFHTKLSTAIEYVLPPKQ